MTIKRCPYCRSIIGDADRYCNSCGTQLLFPEDENVEEPIPGDRIVEVEEEARHREDLVLDSIEAEAKREKAPERGGQEARREFMTRELPEMGRVEPPAPPTPKAPPAEVRRQETEPPSGDFEAGFPTSGREMEEIARLMSTLEKKERPSPEAPPSSPAQPSPREKDMAPVREEEEKPKPSGVQEPLPPWAERVKEGETPGFRAPTQEGISRESGDFAFELPSQPAALRPDDTGETGSIPSSDDFYERRGGGEEAALGRGARPRRRRAKRSVGAKLKAKIYDLLFITLVWILGVWVASRLLGLSLLELVQGSTLEVGIFYLILLVGYFALFLSFLGETLGDRLGSSAR